MPLASDSAFQLAWRSARDGAALVWPALRGLWAPLLLFHGVAFAFAQAVGVTQERVLAQKSEDLFALGSLVAAQLLFSFLWTSAYLVVIGRSLTARLEARVDPGWRESLREAWSQTLIETLRAWASVLRWALALILPGGYVFAKLAWSPFVAALDPAYASGKVDALERSRELTVGRWWWVSLAVAVLGAAAPEVVGILVQGSDDRLTTNPVGVLLGEGLTAVLTLVWFAWAFSAFRALSARAAIPRA